MSVREPYRTRAGLIAQRLIEFESRNPGIVRMRSNWDSFVISAMIQKLRAVGFRKGFLQDLRQFIYNSILSYQKAAEECLPYTLLAGPKNQHGHTHCWAGVGLYVGWYGGLAITEFFTRRTGDLDGVVLIINIEPFFEQISDLLDPVRDAT